MSKHQIVRELRREIAKLNRIIDLAIIRGVSYREEARRHKFLVAQLNRLQPRRSIFSSFSLAHMFMF
ncbi:MAG TPA: hypothetical protein VL335_03350 [Candidatus Paceibacterota bacterium]|jgi:hypothetical protein|nr:hypothetical protein [Candidatus Paceibacterota bacterium]